ncbi:MAG: hypothetical protein EP310_08565 [Bacteroidetes bacterium]|nr:MAG: hypothetical protein EP310_08565 [Bacteroidota bacterium]
MRKNIVKRNSIQILVFILLTVTFSSCSKDDEPADNEYYVRFNANGEKIEFSVQGTVVAAFGQAGSKYNAVFTGYDATSNISLQVFDNKEITTSTYSGYTLSGASFIGALIGYNDKSGTFYMQDALNPVTSIIITEITSTAVKGKFSGTVKAAGKSDISISNGEFYVWRAN